MNDIAAHNATAQQIAALYWLSPVPPGMAPQQQILHPDLRGRIFRIDTCFERGGAWAGVEQLVEAAFLELESLGASDVINAHLVELYLALPQHRQRIRPKHLSLTETVGADERTRFYALDHAYRLIHGLVNVVLQWKRLSGDAAPWIIVAWNFDHAEHLTSRFLSELARRGATERQFDVIVDSAAPAAQTIPGVRPVPAILSLDNVALARPVADSLGSDDIVEIEQRVASYDDITLERKHPVLLAYYRARQDHLALARTAARIFLIYNGFGYYHEAKRFMPDIEANFEALIEGDETKRLHYVGKMNLCLVLTGDAEAGLRVVKELAASYVTKPYVRAGMNYILGMHHLRYAEVKDIDRSERYILQAVDDIQRARDDLSPGAYAFRKVFIDNGLAFVRARQGRHDEALDLCKAGYDFLTREMGEDRHLLHRSVLQYNIAQVYVILGRLEEGLEYYRNAVRMDPNYSEYHNEIGNILQEQGQFQAAIEHYETAIESSPPYPEVYFNKAVCHARLGQFDDALRCFNTSLELEPDHGDRQALRADVLRELGWSDEALDGYGIAITLGYDSAALRVNRAVLRYNKGTFALALSDMDRAINLESGCAEHYENRAAIHRAMECDDLYRRDLVMAERFRAAA